jgi:hypothetical protein
LPIAALLGAYDAMFQLADFPRGVFAQSELPGNAGSGERKHDWHLAFAVAAIVKQHRTASAGRSPCRIQLDPAEPIWPTPAARALLGKRPVERRALGRRVGNENGEFKLFAALIVAPSGRHCPLVLQHHARKRGGRGDFLSGDNRGVGTWIGDATKAQRPTKRESRDRPSAPAASKGDTASQQCRAMTNGIP